MKDRQIDWYRRVKGPIFKNSKTAYNLTMVPDPENEGRFYFVHKNGEVVNVYDARFVYTTDDILDARAFVYRDESVPFVGRKKEQNSGNE